MSNYVTNANATKLMSAIGTNIKDTKITATANSDDIALTDAADARVHDLRIYGKTVDGHSVGENGLTVTACGKNIALLDEYLVDYLQSYSDAFNNVIKPNVTYTLSIRMSKARNKNTNFRLMTSSNQYAVVCSLSAGETYNSITFTLSEPVINSYRYAEAIGESDPATCYLQIEKGSTATAWEPYKSHTENITTALPLRRKMLSVDLGDFDWYYQENAHTEESGILFPRFYTTTKAQGMFDPTRFIRGDGRCDTYLITNEACSSRYTVSNSAGGHEPVTDKTIIMGRDGRIYIIDNSYTDPAEFKAAVTGITLTYPSYCDEIDLADGVAITRLDNNGDVLATPVTTPLSSTEKAAFEAFRTFEGATNLTVTDNPFMSMTYVKNSSSGKALANVDDRIKETDISGKVDKVAGKGLSTEDYTTAEKTKLASLSPITISSTLTLTVAGWDSQTKQQTVLTTIDTTKRNVIDITVSELPTWSECNVYAISESATGVTFQCDTIPSDALTFKITSMVVTTNA